METFEDLISLSFYKNYGISEWHEKCLILTAAEQIQILYDVKNGIKSDLVALVTLPFPKFAECYFGKHPFATPYFKDPAFAYKLYLFDDKTIKFFVITMRKPKMRDYDLKIEGFQKPYHYRDIIADFNRRKLEEIPYNNSVAGKSKVIETKFIYLTQYIDAAEARRLNLSRAFILEQNDENGYGLQGKLSCLNPTSKRIVELYLGLYGDHRHSQKEIAHELGISGSTIKSFFDIVFPLLHRPLTPFKAGIGFQDVKVDENDMHVYTDAKFNEINIALETTYLLNKLSAPEREYLKNNFRPSTLRAYLVAKYMYKTSTSFASAMGLTVKQAEERMAEFK